MLYTTNPNHFTNNQISTVVDPGDINLQENNDDLDRSLSRSVSPTEITNFVEKVSEKLIKIVENQIHESMQM